MAPQWLAPEKGAATSATVNEAVWTDPATSGTTFERTGDQWHYNWKTKGVAAGFTYRIGVRLDDGTQALRGGGCAVERHGRLLDGSREVNQLAY